MARRRSPTRDAILRIFREDPYQSVKEIAARMKVSMATVSQHLITLEKRGEIVRPKLVRDTSKQASTPNDRSQQWSRVSPQKGAIQRREGAMRARKARGEDALQARINDVVKNAEQKGTCFRADYIKLERLGGCKCG